MMDTLEKDNELCEGVTMLLDRMQKYPEEFDGLDVDAHQNFVHHNRWAATMHKYWHVLTEYEKATIKIALREANRKNITAAVIKTVFQNAEEKRQVERKLVESSQLNNGPYTTTITAARTMLGSI